MVETQIQQTRQENPQQYEQKLVRRQSEPKSGSSGKQDGKITEEKRASLPSNFLTENSFNQLHMTNNFVLKKSKETNFTTSSGSKFVKVDPRQQQEQKINNR
eukprot:UN02766